MKEINQEWLNHYSLYGEYIDRSLWDRVVFKRCLNKHPDILRGYVMTFSSPIEHSPGFRVVPNHPRYAVSESGEALDRVTGEKLPVSEFIRTRTSYPGFFIEAVVAKAKELHPNLTFDVEDRWKDRIVQTIKVDTMEVVDESPWVRNAAALMQCSCGVVERLLRLGEQRPKNGYAVRYKTSEPWNILPEECKFHPECIQVSNLETGVTKVYESKREIERELKISRFISTKHLDTGTPYQNYLFKRVSKSA